MMVILYPAVSLTPLVPPASHPPKHWGEKQPFYIHCLSCDTYFQQCGILTSVDSDELLLSIETQNDQQLNTHRIFKRLAKALIRLRICAG